MNQDAFDSKMSELLAKINDLPEAERTRMERVAQETQARRERIRTSVAELQESVDYLRLSVKYLVFDLEATRRENAYLRRLLESAGTDPKQADHHDDIEDGESAF